MFQATEPKRNLNLLLRVSNLEWKKNPWRFCWRSRDFLAISISELWHNKSKPAIYLKHLDRLICLQRAAQADPNSYTDPFLLAIHLKADTVNNRQRGCLPLNTCWCKSLVDEFDVTVTLKIRFGFTRKFELFFLLSFFRCNIGKEM
jgi:hypothetical protein